MSTYDQDMYDLNKLYDLLENEILPTYYDRPDEWRTLTQQRDGGCALCFCKRSDGG